MIQNQKRKSTENTKTDKVGSDFTMKLKLNPNAKPIHFLKNKIIQSDEPNGTYNNQSNFFKNYKISADENAKKRSLNINQMSFFPQSFNNKIENKGEDVYMTIRGDNSKNSINSINSNNKTNIKKTNSGSSSNIQSNNSTKITIKNNANSNMLADDTSNKISQNKNNPNSFTGSSKINNLIIYKK